MTLDDRHFENATEARETDRRVVLGGLVRLAAGSLLLGGGIAGCATSVRKVARPMPDLPSATPMGIPTRRVVTPASVPAPSLPGVLSRRDWTTASPRTSDMRRNPMRLTDITIHHDGLPSPLVSTATSNSKARLDTIRRAHCGPGRDWSDIGYHFAVDRAGRVWQCRPLEWEGAHVRRHNAGNIGVLVMGNFEIERPTSAQLQATNTFVNALCREHEIRPARVKTHKEWADASTQCPGRHLQPRIVAMRSTDFRVA